MGMGEVQVVMYEIGDRIRYRSDGAMATVTSVVGWYVNLRLDAGSVASIHANDLHDVADLAPSTQRSQR